MAEKRMFTQKIVDSDAFLDMSLSAQALYFHLNMRADDDGFVNNPKKIQRMIGASEEDMNVLIEKRFVLVFENGVIAIKHWRMHNLLRKDRYTPTLYQEQFSQLEMKKNGAYTEKRLEPLKTADSEETKTTCQPNGNQMATKWQPHGNQMAHRIDKDRIDKDRIDKDSKEVKEEKSITCKQVVDLFHSICISYPSVRTLSDSRKKAIKARLNTYSIDDFRTLFEKAEASSFLKGSNDRNWSANFDWLIKDANMTKVIDGNYDNKAGSNQVPHVKKNSFNNFTPRDYDIEELEGKLLCRNLDTGFEDRREGEG